MTAAGNAFLATLFELIREPLYQARRQTSSFPEARRHTLAMYRRALAALQSGPPKVARNATHDRLVDTENELVIYSGDQPIATRTKGAE